MPRGKHIKITIGDVRQLLRTPRGEGRVRCRARHGLCPVFIHLGTRKVFLSPPTFHPNDQWVQQQARNMAMWLEDQQLDARFIIHDRDAKFSTGLRQICRDAGIQCVRTPLLAPDANAYAESWIGGIKRRCLNHFLCFSLGHLGHISQELRPVLQSPSTASGPRKQNPSCSRNRSAGQRQNRGIHRRVGYSLRAPPRRVAATLLPRRGVAIAVARLYELAERAMVGGSGLR